MASLYVTEYPEIGVHQGTGVPVAFVPAAGPVQEQKLAIGGASVPSLAFKANSKIVRLHCDAICSVKFGAIATVSASTTDPRMAANQTEYFAIAPDGVTTGLAVITNT